MFDEAYSSAFVYKMDRIIKSAHHTKAHISTCYRLRVRYCLFGCLHASLGQDLKHCIQIIRSNSCTGVRWEKVEGEMGRQRTGKQTVYDVRFGEDWFDR